MNGAEKELLIDEFHTLYFDRRVQTWGETYWLGHHVLKCPLDLWSYQEILHEVRPELIVETGTYRGGSALFLASIWRNRAYAPLVTPGSSLIVEDTNLNGHPVESDHGPGPAETVAAFLAEDAAFARDERREKFLLTFNPGGYLRKREARSGGLRARLRSILPGSSSPR